MSLPQVCPNPGVGYAASGSVLILVAAVTVAVIVALAVLWSRSWRRRQVHPR